MKPKLGEVRHDLKAVVLDLDGTLFRKDKTVSFRTMQALNQWKSLGKEIIIATGRPPRFVFGKVPAELQCGYCVCYNGAEVYHDQQLMYRNLIPGNTVHEILERFSLDYPNCIISVEAENCLFTNSSLEKFDKYLEHEVVDFKIRRFKQAAKILIDITAVQDLSDIYNDLPENCKMVVTGNSLGEIFLKNVSKSAGVQLALDRIGLHLAETIAFGDDNNDRELIAECGIGVAMGNASDEIKQIADIITDTHQEDGIAKILEPIIAQNMGQFPADLVG